MFLLINLAVNIPTLCQVKKQKSLSAQLYGGFWHGCFYYLLTKACGVFLQ
jgi:hypothetical protein